MDPKIWTAADVADEDRAALGSLNWRQLAAIDRMVEARTMATYTEIESELRLAKLRDAEATRRNEVAASSQADEPVV